MTRRTALASTLVVFGALAAAGVTFGSPDTGRPTGASVEAAFDKTWGTYASQLVGMCVGAVDGRVALTKCYGRKAAGDAAKPDRNTLFLIDSVTKTFTATLLALRVQEGVIKSLDDPVKKKYWPFIADRADVPWSLTFADLAQHYSGLPKGDTPPALSENVFLLEAAGCLKSTTCRAGVPGQHYVYSNRGIALLGNLLAVNDGFADGPLGTWTLDNYENIVLPLGMSSTKTWDHWHATDPLYYGLHRAIGTGSNGEDHFASQPYGDPAGSLYSSARDMLKWLQYSMGVKGSEELMAAHHWLYDDVLLRSRGGPGKKVGLVWAVDNTTGTTCVAKDGGGLGFAAYVVFVEHQRRGVFVLLNNQPATKVGKIATALLNGLPATPGAASATC